MVNVLTEYPGVTDKEMEDGSGLEVYRALFFGWGYKQWEC